MLRILCLTGLLYCTLFASGQDFTNKGKEFWLGFGNHQQMYTSTLPGMDIYITADMDTRVTVSIPGLGITIGTYTIRANQITPVTDIPKDAFLQEEGISNKGIHISAEHPVVVYAQIYMASVTGATLCLPVSTIGREYYSINFDQASNPGPTNESSYSWFFVVAVEDSTQVQIVPAAGSLSGSMTAGQPYTILLNRGQVFNYLSRSDLTGSVIRTLNSGTGCKKVAVYSGSGRIGIGCQKNFESGDNLIQQLYPTSTWGKKYLTVPSDPRPLNYYRVIRPDPSARVMVDGQTIPSAAFVNNFHYTFHDALPHVIESDKPIQVAQYFTNQDCGEQTGNGDPEMIFLNPVEQVITRSTLVSMRLLNSGNAIHNIMAVVKNDPAAIASFAIDGQSHAAAFTEHPADPAYAYAQIGVEQGPHTITCDTPFNAIAYGFSEKESYGYSAGTNLSDLYQYVTVENDHSPVNIPASCRNSPFRLAMTFPYQPERIEWVFGPALNALGIRDTLILNPAFDTSWTVNGGLRLYRYRLKKTLRIDRPGTYPIIVKLINPTSDGCTGEQEVHYDFQVFEKPAARFSVAHNGCITDQVLLKDITPASARPFVNWYWDLGDGRIVKDVQELAHQFASAGTYTIRHAVATDLGCMSDTASRDLRIDPLPLADFEFRSPLCEQLPVQMASISTSNGDPLTRWNWDFGDGQTLAATSGSPVNHRYDKRGRVTVGLEVATARGCKSLRKEQTIDLHPLPSVNFGVPEVCVDDPFARFSDSSSIIDGSEGSFSWFWQFGDNTSAAGQHAEHRYAAAGNYRVSLKVTSGEGCAASFSRSFTVNGRVQAADFRLVNGQTFCANSELVITDATRIESGRLSGLTIWWDYDRDPTIKTEDEDPAPGKEYAHKYPDFSQPLTRDHRVLYEARTGDACLGVFRRFITLKASPVVAFDAMLPVCQETPAFALPARETLGFPGNGLFDGVGTDAQGNFSPATAGPGLHTIGYRFRAANGCSSSASQNILVNPTPVANAGPDKGILPGGIAILEGRGSGDGLRYSWLPSIRLNDPSRAQPAASPVEDTRYMLTVSSRDGCEARDEMLVKVLPKIIVPNAFTPNGDGINDTWVLLYMESYPNCIVEVFNRYGQRVFHSSGYGRAWDGRMNGSLLPAGTYYWLINPKNGRELLKGSVTLIR